MRLLEQIALRGTSWALVLSSLCGTEEIKKMLVCQYSYCIPRWGDNFRLCVICACNPKSLIACYRAVFPLIMPSCCLFILTECPILWHDFYGNRQNSDINCNKRFSIGLQLDNWQNCGAYVIILCYLSLLFFWLKIMSCILTSSMLFCSCLLARWALKKLMFESSIDQTKQKRFFFWYHF